MHPATYLFNRTPIRARPDHVTGLDPRLIEATPNLRRASLPNAAMFGGPLVRKCLEQAPLAGDRLHIIVDTKVSMLMPGRLPACFRLMAAAGTEHMSYPSSHQNRTACSQLMQSRHGHPDAPRTAAAEQGIAERP